MQKRAIAPVVLTAFLFVFASTSFGAWSESRDQGMSIRHPKGWKVDWREMSVNVGHLEYPIVWCLIQFTPFHRASRQLAEAR